MVNDVFPLQVLGRRNDCCFNLNLIPNAFLKATSTISVSSYPPYLIDLGKDIQLSYHPPYPNRATHPLVVHLK
jgi:hypothetical protein